MESSRLESSVEEGRRRRWVFIRVVIEFKRFWRESNFEREEEYRDSVIF